MNHKTWIAALGITMAATTPAMAQLVIRPMFGMSVTGGGETLVTVQYTNGSSQSIRSGGLVHLFAGMEIQPLPALAVQLNVGYHADNSNARNASVKFTRVPVEALVLWNAADNLRLGVGARKATSARLSSSGDASQTIGDQDVSS